MADRLGDYIAGSAIEIIETEKLIRRYKDKIVERVFYHGKTPEEVVLELQKILEEKRVRMNTFQVPFVYSRTAQSTKNIEAWKEATKITEGRKFVKHVPGPRYAPAPVSASISTSGRRFGASSNGAATSEGRFALFSKKIAIAQTKRVVYQTIARVSKVTEGGKLLLKKPLVISKPSIPQAPTPTPFPPSESVQPSSAPGPSSVSYGKKAKVEPTTTHTPAQEAGNAVRKKGILRRAIKPPSDLAVVPTPTSGAPPVLVPKVLVVNAKLDIDRLEALHKASTPVEADSDRDTSPHPASRERPDKAKAKARDKDRPLPTLPGRGPSLVETDDTPFAALPKEKLAKPAIPHDQGPSKVETDATSAAFPKNKAKPTDVVVPNEVVAIWKIPTAEPAIPPSRPPTISTVSLPKKKDAEVQATPVEVIAPIVQPVRIASVDGNGANTQGSQASRSVLGSLPTPPLSSEIPPRPTRPPPTVIDSDAGGRQPHLSSILRHSEARTLPWSEDVDIGDSDDRDENSRLDLHILGLLAFALLLLAMAAARRA